MKTKSLCFVNASMAGLTASNWAELSAVTLRCPPPCEKHLCPLHVLPTPLPTLTVEGKAKIQFEEAKTHLFFLVQIQTP